MLALAGAVESRGPAAARLVVADGQGVALDLVDAQPPRLDALKFDKVERGRPGRAVESHRAIRGGGGFAEDDVGRTDLHRALAAPRTLHRRRERRGELALRPGERRRR